MSRGGGRWGLWPCGPQGPHTSGSCVAPAGPTHEWVQWGTRGFMSTAQQDMRVRWQLQPEPRSPCLGGAGRAVWGELPLPRVCFIHFGILLCNALCPAGG